MYGMIHRALRSMVIEKEGISSWNEIEIIAKIGPGQMISAEIYEDELTLKIIESCSKVLNKPMEKILTEFGNHWIRFSDSGAFKDILNFTGGDIREFIVNLNRMHQAIRAVMPQAVMPHFGVLGESAGKLIVEYRSERTGLEPFVTGLLQGLLERFGIEGGVESNGRSDDASIYIIHYKDKPI